MKKYFLSFPLLFWALEVLAHVGEEVEEHAEEIAKTGTNIGPLVFGGVLGLGIVAFILWLLFKK